MSYVIRKKKHQKITSGSRNSPSTETWYLIFLQKKIKKRESNKSAIYINLKPQHILLIFIPHTEINPSIALNWKSVPSHDNVPIIIFFLLLLRIEWVRIVSELDACIYETNGCVYFFSSSSCCFKSISLNINTLFYKPHIPPHYIIYEYLFDEWIDTACNDL